MIIAVDFDGTCVSHEFPNIGKDIGAEPILKEFVARNHKLILWTIRSGENLAAAEKWFSDRDIKLYGVNNLPEQATWSSSRKVYAHLYIDDAALGAPVIKEEGQRPYIDWKIVKEIVEAIEQKEIQHHH